METSFSKEEIEHKNYRYLYNTLNKSISIIMNGSINCKYYGIYFIYNDNEEVVYIGKTTNISSRLTTHIRGKYKNANMIKFANIMYLEKESLDDIERFYIQTIKPIDNILVEQSYSQSTVKSFLFNDDIYFPLRVPDLIIYPKEYIIKGYSYVTRDYEIVNKHTKDFK